MLAGPQRPREDSLADHVGDLGVEPSMIKAGLRHPIPSVRGPMAS